MEGCLENSNHTELLLINGERTKYINSAYSFNQMF